MNSWQKATVTWEQQAQLSLCVSVEILSTASQVYEKTQFKSLAISYWRWLRDDNVLTEDRLVTDRQTDKQTPGNGITHALHMHSAVKIPSNKPRRKWQMYRSLHLVKQQVCRAQMYAGRVACCPWWVTVSMATGQTDRRTDGRMTDRHVTFSTRHGQRYKRMMKFQSTLSNERITSRYQLVYSAHHCAETIITNKA